MTGASHAGDAGRDGVILLNGYAAYKMGDYQTAHEIWEPLARQGNPTALLNIANMYEQGQGLEKNLGKAFELTRRAAETGFPNAQLNLGLLYEQGKGVERNLDLAAQWFRLAAEQGSTEAQYNLGVMLATRFGNSKPESAEMALEARKWLGKAAEKGHPGARDVLKYLPQ